MQLVPVLEIRHGKGVHTEPKNRFVDEVIKEDVLEVVKRWVDNGATRIHVVDVDAVESGEPENVDLISKIKQQFPQVQLQVIGGIRSVESAYVWIDAGADFLVLNGRAMRQQDLLDDMCVEFPNQVLVEVDCRRGDIGMGNGESSYKLANLARRLEDDGIVGLVVTDVAAYNGELNARLANIGEVSDSIEIPIFVNGMIEQLADLKNVLASNLRKPSGILIGKKALYNGEFCLKEAHAILEEHQIN